MATDLALIGTAGALFLSGLVALLLSRRITKPVAAASSAAKRIASGQLDAEIPAGGDDELGALLAAMRTMRDNIRSMMEREVAQRRTAQVRLADALESSREGIVVVDSESPHRARQFAGQRILRRRDGLARTREHPRDATAEPNNLVPSALSLNNFSQATGEIRLQDGRWLRVSRSATQDGGFIALFSDISVSKEQEAKLKATNLLLRRRAR